MYVYLTKIPTNLQILKSSVLAPLSHKRYRANIQIDKKDMPVSKQKKTKRKHSKPDKDSLHNPPLSVTTWGNLIKSGLLVCKTTIDDNHNIGVGYDRVKMGKKRTPGKRDCHRASGLNVNISRDEPFTISSGLQFQ